MRWKVLPLLFLSSSLLIPPLFGDAKDTTKARKHLAKAAEHAARYKIKKMRKEAEKARKNDPSLGESYAYLGLYYYRKQEFEKAKKLFELSIKRNSSIALPRVYLGNVLYEVGEFDRALDQWNLASRLDDTDSEALSSLALGLYILGREKDAIQRYMQALQWDKRYHDPAFLGDFKKGAAWTPKRVKAVRPLLEKVPAPLFKY